MTDAEINKAVAERVCGGTLGYGGEPYCRGAWMANGSFVPHWSPATRWGHAMMAAEAWANGAEKRTLLTWTHKGTDGALYLQVSAAGHERTKEFTSGPRALCEALLAAVEAEQKL